MTEPTIARLRADGLGYCTVFCDPAEPSCPEYFVCRPTLDSDEHICAL